MKFRQTHPVPTAAAKAGISPASGYRLEADPRLPSQKNTPHGRRKRLLRAALPAAADLG